MRDQEEQQQPKVDQWLMRIKNKAPREKRREKIEREADQSLMMHDQERGTRMDQEKERQSKEKQISRS